MEISQLEWDVLNCVYFVETFDKILDEVAAPTPVVADVVKTLIHKKMIVSMQWDEQKQDYIRSFMYDSDNMQSYAYLITKEGLMAHNTL